MDSALVEIKCVHWISMKEPRILHQNEIENVTEYNKNTYLLATFKSYSVSSMKQIITHS